ncbi:hypothetical protein [Streptomyces sp. wa1063]|uniref:hypothetical protein n=1 Tax=Streptomyces sp. wa1063 TaxID=1828212 RepID=UPI0011805D73|nr:hypothetical protein [Streptomyces sp. wa1063]
MAVLGALRGDLGGGRCRDHLSADRPQRPSRPADHRRRATDVVTLEPKTRTAGRVVRATVAGEVPYSVEGYDYLTLAPGPVPGGRGRLATTPDAYGKVVLRPLPDTLVPVRLRGKHVTDPHYGSRSSEVVLECRDGETPVLIVAERHAMRWILGALPLPAD